MISTLRRLFRVGTFALIGLIVIHFIQKGGKGKSPDTAAGALDQVDWTQPLEVLSKESGTFLLCGGNPVNQLPYIRHYADSITALNLPYSQSQANDCSGTFIRLNEYLNSKCPEASFPSFNIVRTSGDLMAYYNGKKQLVIIDHPLEQDHLIRPGAVMFYAQSGFRGKVSASINEVESLVNHVGVVYDVRRDENTKKVLSYSLFHGRSPANGINITDFHSRNPGGKMEGYPYGNGTQQWIAVAPIVDNR